MFKFIEKVFYQTVLFTSMRNCVFKNSAALPYDVAMPALWQHIVQVGQQAKLTCTTLTFGVPPSHHMIIE